MEKKSKLEIFLKVNSFEKIFPNDFSTFLYCRILFSIIILGKKLFDLETFLVQNKVPWAKQ